MKYQPLKAVALSAASASALAAERVYTGNINTYHTGSSFASGTYDPVAGGAADIDYVLKLMYFPSLRYAETFDIKFNHASPMEDMSFTIKGMSNAMKQSEKMCMSNFDLQEPEIQETSFI